jgi:hypothetical protein
MGHAEMLLAVAGLSKNAIAERVGGLESGNWSAFAARDRAAFRFAHRQSAGAPAAAAREVPALVAQFGPDRALDVIWWSCRCHYMTCVSDAFQLPLEKDNVFDGFLSDGPGMADEKQPRP